MKIDLKSYPIWHPFSQMSEWAEMPKIIRAEGVWLYDEKGNKVMDAISSWWVNLHGHAHPHIAKRVKAQLDRFEHVIFAGFTHDHAIELCERLPKHLPQEDWKFFFSDNGSTSIEVALKLAIQKYIQHDKVEKVTIIALEGAYHGDTFGAMSAGARGFFSDPFEQHLFEVKFIPSPTKENAAVCMKALQEALGEHNVFIFEPLVQGAGGMIMHDKALLDDLLREAKKNKTITIADEVMTGFGRTGTWFASNQLKQVPDMICLSKGLTGGALPMSLTVCKQWVYDVFLTEDLSLAFLHGHSFTGNPLACAAACASLDLMEEKKTWEQIEMISSMHREAAERMKDWGSVKSVRTCGTILAIQVESDLEAGYMHPVRVRLYDAFMKQGMLIRPLGDVIYLLPPYVIKREELLWAYQMIEEVLYTEVESNLKADVH